MKAGVLAIGLLALIALLVLLSLNTGASGFTLRDFMAPSDVQRTILLQLRLPRTLLALLAGAALGVSGALMQTFFRNPLAEPYITGVSAGGALGAVAGSALGLASPLAIGACALSGSGAITSALYSFALGSRRSSLSILLLGLALGTLCGALVWLILLRMGPAGSTQAIGWLLGSVSAVGYTKVIALGTATALGSALAFALRRQLDVMLLGDEKAASLGLNLLAARRLVLAAAALLAASAVAFCGIIAFVGLMVPHVMRRVAGSTHARLLPLCLLGGAALVLAMDIAARAALPPSEIPLTVLTSLIGAPFFIAVLLSSREVAM